MRAESSGACLGGVGTKFAIKLSVMNAQESALSKEDPTDRRGRTAGPDPDQEVIGWLLFIRHYGGNLRKYGGPSGEDRVAQA